jgi:hypothetical protein
VKSRYVLKMCAELIQSYVLQESIVLSSQSGGTCGGALWLGVALWFVPSIIAGWRLAVANADFLRMYRNQVDPNTPTLDELARGATWPSWVWWIRSIRLSRQIRVAQREPGVTPAMEEARRRIRRWRRVAIATCFAGMVFPLVLCFAAGG